MIMDRIERELRSVREIPWKAKAEFFYKLKKAAASLDEIDSNQETDMDAETADNVAEEPGAKKRPAPTAKKPETKPTPPIQEDPALDQIEQQNALAHLEEQVAEGEQALQQAQEQAAIAAQQAQELEMQAQQVQEQAAAVQQQATQQAMQASAERDLARQDSMTAQEESFAAKEQAMGLQHEMQEYRRRILDAVMSDPAAQAAAVTGAPMADLSAVQAQAQAQEQPVQQKTASAEMATRLAGALIAGGGAAGLQAMSDRRNKPGQPSRKEISLAHRIKGLQQENKAHPGILGKYRLASTKYAKDLATINREHPAFSAVGAGIVGAAAGAAAAPAVARAVRQAFTGVR